MVGCVSDDRPNPLADVIRGLGLLLRAAKTTVEKLPTKDLEEAIVASAREVGRALENVATAVEREVFGRTDERGGHGGGDNRGATETPPVKPPPAGSEARKDDPKPPGVS